MHLAYKNSTKKSIQEKLHYLATSPVRGPKLRIPIPEEMEILEKEPILSALDCLLNYNKDEINLDLEEFDGMFTTTYLPEGMNEVEEHKYFNDQFAWLNEVISKTCKDTFNTSVNDCNLPEETEHDAHTRDALKQYWEASYNLSDDMTICCSEAKELLQGHRGAFNKWCHARKASDNRKKDGES